MSIRNVFSKFMQAKSPEQKARQKLFSIRLQKKDIAIDCGANVGKITQHFSEFGAKVYSFEPNPYAFEVLQERFNNVPNVECIPKGVGPKKGRMKLYLHENSDKDEVYWSTGSSFLAVKGNVLMDKYVEVEVVDLCDFIESLNRRVRILKMDVEGIECMILEKIIKTGVIDKIDYAFVETHDHKIPELKSKTHAIRKLIKERRIKKINLDWT